jgi:hypothetical protein
MELQDQLQEDIFQVEVGDQLMLQVLKEQEEQVEVEMLEVHQDPVKTEQLILEVEQAEVHQ